MAIINRFEEKDLIRRAKNRDRAAAEDLLERHYPFIFSFLYQMAKNREAAQDMTQETFIRAWQSLDSFEERSRFSTWLYRIAYYLYLDECKKKKLRTTELNEQAYMADSSIPSPDERLMLKEQMERIDMYVDRLTPRKRAVIVMHYRQELTFGEIADILDLPRGTVKSRLHNALSHLRQIMQEERRIS